MKMTITSISCQSTCSVPPKADNVFLLIQADAGPPIRYPAPGVQNMTSGDSMTLPPGGYVVDFEYGAVVTGWDQDSVVIKDINSPDFLFNFSANVHSGSQSSSLYNKNGAGYSWTFQISQ